MGKATGLAKEQDRALGLLREVPELAAFYLAGGSAIAVHLGHRRSDDIDLFGPNDADLARVLEGVRRRCADAETAGSSEVVLKLLVRGASVDLVRYPYPPLDPPTPGPHEVPVAGLRDLAAMKVATIAGRGLRRDFWDLHEIATRAIPLREAASAYLARFGLAQPDLYHVVRCLTWFEDAEKERTLPRGLTTKHWSEIKAWFRKEAPKLLTPG